MKIAVVYRISFCALSHFCLLSSLTAQLCNGPVGQPAAIIDFGSGGIPASGIRQVPAPYQYSNSDCPPEGSYSIRDNTNLCFTSLWHMIPFDHTPDIAGNFLLINARPGRTDLFIDTVRGLCAGRPFEFSAWMLNLVNGTGCDPNVNPSLVISVYSRTNVLLGSYSTGEIAVSQPFTWVNHKFQFDLPAGINDIVIKITNNAPEGCGNDLALDDITISPCSGNIVASFVGNNDPEINVCEENETSYLLTSSFSGFSNPVIQWELSYDGSTFFNIDGANANTYARAPTGAGVFFYRYIISETGSPNCRFSSNVMKVTVIKSPFAQATNYVTGCYGSPVTLFAAGGIDYEWTGPNGFFSNQQGPVIPFVDFSHQGRYIVKVTDHFGCPAYDTTDMTVYYAPVATVTASEFTICEGESVQLNANNSFSYLWSPAEGLSNTTIANPIATPVKSTAYAVIVYNQELTCSDTAHVMVNVWSRPTANAGPDKFTYNKKPVILQGTAEGSGLRYEWSPAAHLNDPSILRPQANPPQTIIYTLTVTSDHGCGIASDDVKVEVIDKLFIPSAFTPNRDGLNDIWQLITFDTYPEATVNVYNRWGQLVYASTGSNYQPWDGSFKGEPVETGTYVYFVKLSKNAAILKGTVSVIR